MAGPSWKKSITRFLTAQTISLFGSSIVQYAIVWYITLTTSSGSMMTIATLCGFLPQIVISLFAGVWIDRYDRKKLVMISDTVIAASTLLLAVVFYRGNRAIWLLLAVLAIRSAGSGIQNPAVNAIIPQIVPGEHLMRVNGINSTLSSVIMFLSLAVSGAILSVVPLEATLFVDVFTAVIGVGITVTVPIAPYMGKKQKGNTHLEDIRGGFRYLKESRYITRLLIFQVLILFLISPSAFLTPLMVSRTFGEEVWRLSVSEMTYSLGMIAGGVLIAWWGGFQNKLHTTILNGCLYGILMMGLGAAPGFAVYLLCNTLIGITSPCYSTPITATIQEKVAPEMHGRIFSLMQIATSCALPLGMLLFGPLADVVGVQLLLLVSGSFVAVICVLAYVTSFLGKGDNKKNQK